ncbi:hypothetical protein AUH73_07790 [archaeon 13_1_40CM_4_53_4]|nr:MAG: hypothetical protein AUH73_07790 [archaeon 13_1_40CM_4_53_4]
MSTSDLRELMLWRANEPSSDSLFRLRASAYCSLLLYPAEPPDRTPNGPAYGPKGPAESPRAPDF